MASLQELEADRSEPNARLTPNAGEGEIRLLDEEKFPVASSNSRMTGGRGTRIPVVYLSTMFILLALGVIQVSAFTTRSSTRAGPLAFVNAPSWGSTRSYVNLGGTRAPRVRLQLSTSPRGEEEDDDEEGRQRKRDRIRDWFGGSSDSREEGSQSRIKARFDNMFTGMPSVGDILSDTSEDDDIPDFGAIRKGGGRRKADPAWFEEEKQIIVDRYVPLFSMNGVS
jgi:hypothetical protein